MPYLHWETDARRRDIANAISSVALSYKKKQLADYQESRRRKQEARRGLPPSNLPKLTSPPNDHSRTPAELKRLIRTVTEAVSEVTDQTGRPLLAGFRESHPLARVLLSAARLYEDMMTPRDKKLIEGFLCKEPPLHPRRTLDQSYYWTLRSTEARDRDQVVYRHTHSSPASRHKFGHGQSKGPLSGNPILLSLFASRKDTEKERGGLDHGPGSSLLRHCACSGHCACKSKDTARAHPPGHDQGHKHDCAGCMSGWCW